MTIQFNGMSQVLSTGALSMKELWRNSFRVFAAMHGDM
jgi:hypothetical protein